MIRDLLEQLFIRQLSFQQIEGELSIDRTTLQSRLEMLVHMGYLERTTMSMGGCDGGCMGCAKNTIPECSEGNEGKSISGFELTGKGKRILGM